MKGDQGPRGMDGAKGAQGRPVGTFCSSIKNESISFFAAIAVMFFFFKFIVRLTCVLIKGWPRRKRN